MKFFSQNKHRDQIVNLFALGPLLEEAGPGSNWWRILNIQRRIEWQYYGSLYNLLIMI